jgi:Mediator complex subunit 16
VLGVTRSGLLRLLYQNPDHRWADASAELKHAGHSDRLLTHAALVATPGTLSVTVFPVWTSTLMERNIRGHSYRNLLGLPEDRLVSRLHLVESSQLGPKPAKTASDQPSLPDPDLSFSLE